MQCVSERTLGITVRVQGNENTSMFKAKNWICSELGGRRQGCSRHVRKADDSKGENGGVINTFQVSTAFLSPKKRTLCLWYGFERVSLNRHNTKKSS